MNATEIYKINILIYLFLYAMTGLLHVPKCHPVYLSQHSSHCALCTNSELLLCWPCRSVTFLTSAGYEMQPIGKNKQYFVLFFTELGCCAGQGFQREPIGCGKPGRDRQTDWDRDRETEREGINSHNYGDWQVQNLQGGLTNWRLKRIVSVQRPRLETRELKF